MISIRPLVGFRCGNRAFSGHAKKGVNGLPSIRQIGINTVVVTCDPANIASARTIDARGAKLVLTSEVEIEPGVFRRTNVYQVYVNG